MEPLGIGFHEGPTGGSAFRCIAVTEGNRGVLLWASGLCMELFVRGVKCTGVGQLEIRRFVVLMPSCLSCRRNMDL